MDDLAAETERHTCVRELLGHLLAGADTSELPFSRALTSWRSTAVAWSDPQVARELQGPVPRRWRRGSTAFRRVGVAGRGTGCSPASAVGRTVRRPQSSSPDALLRMGEELRQIPLYSSAASVGFTPPSYEVVWPAPCFVHV